MIPQAKKQLSIFDIAPTGTIAPLEGSQRPLSQIYASVLRAYDTEIPESTVREPNRGKELVEICNWNYEARHCLSIAVDDTFASADGDDMGWIISDWQDKHRSVPINPDTKAILADLVNRKETIDQWVLGGDKLEKALKQALGYGDSFIEIGVENDGTGYGVSNLMYLPTFEIFRRESDQGVLEGFDQRRFMSARKPEAEFDPCQIVHIRNDRQFLYGHSIFAQSLQAWGYLKQATTALAQAATNLGVNPTLHILPPEFDESDRQVYVQSFQNRQLDGIITDLFLFNNTELKKLQSDFPNLGGLVDTCNYWKYQIIPPGFPVWFFPGLDNTGAADIAGEPARKYGRMRQSWCSLLSKAIKQVCDTELVLRRGYDWYKENGQYRIEWPVWNMQQTGLAQQGEQDGTGQYANQQPNGGGNTLYDDDGNSRERRRRSAPLPYDQR
jgi:hypothetical protein